MRNVKYRWHLRQVMADRGMFATSDLAPLLAERGVELSTSQVFRLVTGTPERLNCQVLAALCDALDCGPGELFEPYVLTSTARRTSTAGKGSEQSPAKGLEPPVRARVVDT
ncbi:MAG: helix-turn-helix domain-containing protein [Dermatophilaceae bacterium]